MIILMIMIIPRYLCEQSLYFLVELVSFMPLFFCVLQLFRHLSPNENDNNINNNDESDGTF